MEGVSRRVALAALALLAAGCSMHLGNDTLPQGAALSFRLGGAAKTFLYVLDGQNKVLVFGPSATTAIRTYGVNGASAIAVSASGALFVAHATNVTVHAPGSTALERTIVDGIHNASSLAFDAAGNLYVGNSNGVTAYAPGTVHPFRRLRGPAANKIGFDGSGNLYAFSQGPCFEGCRKAKILMYPPGASKPLYQIGVRSQPIFDVVIGSDGYVYTISPDGGIAVYAPGGIVPRLLIYSSCAPWAAALDATQALYVANAFDSCDPSAKAYQVSVYAPHGKSLAGSIKTGVFNPRTIAIDASGNVYVGNQTTITVYAAGESAPTRTLAGVSYPAALAFGSK